VVKAPAKATTGARPAAAPSANRTSGTVPTVDPWADDPNHQSARKIAKSLIAEFTSQYLPQVAEAISSGNKEALDLPLRQLRKVYDSRVPPEVRKAHDYLQDEITALVQEVKKSMAPP
jgi:hypothetical protein